MQQAADIQVRGRFMEGEHYFEAKVSNLKTPKAKPNHISALCIAYAIASLPPIE